MIPLTVVLYRSSHGNAALQIFEGDGLTLSMRRAKWSELEYPESVEVVIQRRRIRRADQTGMPPVDPSL